ncbi:hypothetical protein CKO35_04065 [Ectothiorhodospira shaposhnikovii]|nr:hypothetical protein [Ectothiorhodospira shaposhnikovii]
MAEPLFTIFIPAHNRGHVIGNALDSISVQTFGSWEIIVVDDGSDDDTSQVVSDWSSRHSVPLRYVRQDNGGKHVAHNHAVSLARGELLMVLDSDDVLLPDALEKLAGAWRDLPESRRAVFAGVEGLCITSAGVLHGQPYPRDVFDGDYLELRGRHGVGGEKRSALRVDVLRAFPYPVFAGETHVRPSFIWKRIAHRHKMRFINQVVQVVDFARDGLTASASRRRLKNTRGLFAYWRDDVLNHQAYLCRGERVRHYSEYVRYGLHAGQGLAAQWREVPERTLWLRALLRGGVNFLGDRVKMRRYR